MKRPTLASFVRYGVSFGFAASVLAACGGDDNPSSTLIPFRDNWQVEAEVPFDYLDGDGNPQISSISIGNSTPISDNFMNRGDVIVQFADTDTITIELRRFTMATNEDLAQEDYDALQLWAYSAGAARPEDLDPETDCTQGGWQNDCRILVYYDGQTQLSRSGADIRVTMPSNYRHTLNIATADNDTDSDYHNRSNVCVQNPNGTVDIDLGNPSPTAPLPCLGARPPTSRPARAGPTDREAKRGHPSVPVWPASASSDRSRSARSTRRPPTSPSTFRWVCGRPST